MHQIGINCLRQLPRLLLSGYTLNQFKVNNKDNWTTSLTSSDVFIINFEQVSQIILVLLLLILNK